MGQSSSVPLKEVVALNSEVSFNRWFPVPHILCYCILFYFILHSSVCMGDVLYTILFYIILHSSVCMGDVPYTILNYIILHISICIGDVLYATILNYTTYFYR